MTKMTTITIQTTTRMRQETLEPMVVRKIPRDDTINLFYVMFGPAAMRWCPVVLWRWRLRVSTCSARTTRHGSADPQLTLNE